MRKIFNTAEKTAEAFVFIHVLFGSLQPIVLSFTTRMVPPVMFAAASTLFAGVGLFGVLLWRGQLVRVWNKRIFLYSLLVSMLVVVLPSIFIYIGASMTSGINTALLMQTEMLAAFILCGLFFGEKITVQKTLGAGVIAVGAFAVLYNGSFHFNKGDLFIMLGATFYPLGNIYAKRILKTAPPAIILFIRNIFGGMVLLIISLLFEQGTVAAYGSLMSEWIPLVVNGFFILFISKMFWYEGLKVLDVSKATMINMTAPAFSLIYAATFLREIPNVYQFVGFIIVLIGLFITTKTSTAQALRVADGGHSL